MEPINIGVIGLGNMGLLHSKWLKRSDRFRLIAVADVDEERTSSVANPPTENARPTASATPMPFATTSATPSSSPTPTQAGRCST